MANEIVWFDDTETGAPTLNNAAGSLDAVLYACLVTGFNPKSGLAISVAGGVATVTLASHGYTTQKMVDIAGAGTSAINGRKLITVTGSGSFTFPAPGVADGTISGSITAKRSPLGWLRDLNSANVSIYKRSDSAATAMGLRIDDTGAGIATVDAARVRMVEAWSDLNTFTGPAPTDTQLSGGFYWTKGANSTTAKKWVIVGDSRTFYLFSDCSTYPASSFNQLPTGIYGFGDLASFRSPDAYGAFLSGSTSAGGTSSFSPGSGQSLGVFSSSNACVLSRPYSGVGTAIYAVSVTPGAGMLGAHGAPYPSPVDSGLPLSLQVLAAENNSVMVYPLRGAFRGLAEPLVNFSVGALAANMNRQVLSGFTGSTKSYLMTGFQQAGSYGMAAFDLTGPWA